MRVLSLLALAACTDVTDPVDPLDEVEVITTVDLTFTPSSGPAIEAVWTDPEDDGSPVVDDIVLALGETYTLTVEFFNGLESPPEDITTEIRDEAEEHQVFFTGTAVRGPASAGVSAVIEHSYSDTDAGGLPIGLENEIEAIATSTGRLFVTLRHLPAEDGSVVKTADLAQTISSEGFEAIGGDTDVRVDFEVTVE